MLRSLSLVATTLLLATLAACSSYVQLAAPATQAGVPAARPQIEKVFVASSRGLMAGSTAERADSLTFASFDVSVPPGHVPGEPPRETQPTGDPARAFVIGDDTVYDGAASFDKAVIGYTGRYSPPAEAVVFVHGFNTSFVESIYQLAQIGHDIELPAAKVLYSWPSTGRMIDYLHDLDSIAFARDGLERLLDGLAASGVKRIVVVGYSMGATLVVETLRQMKLVGSKQFFSRLDGVVLLSPDMDIDLFRIEAERMGGLPQPFVIYSAPKDPALTAVARYLTAGKPRLGILPDPSALASLALTYVDVANVPHHRQSGHLPVATSSQMIEAINAMPRPNLADFATRAANGGVPGAEVKRFGKLTYVTLPPPGN